MQEVTPGKSGPSVIWKSMRDQNRNVTICQDVLRGSSEELFAKDAVLKGAHDEQTRVDIFTMGQDRLADVAALVGLADAICLNAVSRQCGRDVDPLKRIPNIAAPRL